MLEVAIIAGAGRRMCGIGIRVPPGLLSSWAVPFYITCSVCLYGRPPGSEKVPYHRLRLHISHPLVYE
jgi:hypothetical protein